MKLLTSIIALMLVSCSKQDKQSEWIGRSLIGVPPVLGMECTESDLYGAFFEFEGKPEVLLDWLYYWSISRKRFEFISIEEFVRDSKLLIDAEKSAILYTGEVDYLVDAKVKRFDVQVTIESLNKDLWRCKTRIMRLD